MTNFVGNISQAAVTKTVNVGGVPTLVTTFSVAENYGTKEKPATQYYRISLWREPGAKLAQYLTLGRPIYVEGRVRGRAYIDKNGQAQCQLEMANPHITFITASKKAETTDAPEEAVEVDDLPFADE